MSNDLNVSAASRGDFGKGASRRLRRENLVPAILYGAEDEPQAIQLKHNEVTKHLSNEAFYSQLLMLSVDGGEPIRTLLRDVQRHPHKQQILHLDFQRVVAGAELTVTVSVHFVNEESCVGVKRDGGIINHIENELTVSCLPRNIPEYLEVDMGNVEVGGSVLISDINFPEGVSSVDLSHGEDHDRPIAGVSAPRAAAEEESNDEPAADPGEVPTAGDEGAAE